MSLYRKLLTKHRTQCISTSLFAHEAIAISSCLKPLRNTFSTLQRSTKYGWVESHHVEAFKSILQNSEQQCWVNVPKEQSQPYLQDWLGLYQPKKVNAKSHQCILFPKTIEELQKLVKYCNHHHLAICPQGGNTGLVGGSVPVYDEVVINTQKLNQILDFDPDSGIVTVEAGCILQTLDDYLKKQTPSYIAPLDLGAKGSCQIGGNLSANAGGIRYSRYGNLAGNTLGLEAVLADGSLFSSLHPLKKDNTGFKLHQLFIGSEGTLGIITKAILQCPLAPQSVQLCLLKCRKFDHSLNACQYARSKLSDILSAMEFFDHTSMNQVLRYLPDSRSPFENNDYEDLSTSDTLQYSDPYFYLLLETHGQDETSDQIRMENVVQQLIEKSLILDGVWAENETKKLEIWKIRETISEAMSTNRKCYKLDVTLPQRRMYEPVELVRKKLDGKVDGLCVGYGHLGDCNLHLNITANTSADFEIIKSIVDPWLYDYVIKAGGSISAEHGLGLMKAPKINQMRPKNFLSMMSNIKHTLDPHAILNPYKVMNFEEY